MRWGPPQMMSTRDNVDTRRMRRQSLDVAKDWSQRPPSKRGVQRRQNRSPSTPFSTGLERMRNSLNSARLALIVRRLGNLFERILQIFNHKIGLERTAKIAGEAGSFLGCLRPFLCPKKAKKVPADCQIVSRAALAVPTH